MNETILRKIIRETVIEHIRKNSLMEQKEKENASAVDELEQLNSDIMNVARSVMQKNKNSSVEIDKGKKKTESVTMIAAGTLLGLPGLLELMSKSAKLLRKTLNKHFKTGTSVEQEGETLEKWAQKTHHFYIDKLFVPIVKVVFKKYVKGNESQAKKFAIVLYAVLLAVVAGEALGTSAHHIITGLKDVGHVFSTAYEAAHAAHGTLDAAKLASTISTAFSAVGETVLADAITV